MRWSSLTRLPGLHAGDFFGELGLMTGQRTRHVVARESLTCLVLSRTPVRPYAGRGASATSPAQPPPPDLPPGTCAVDVTSHLHRKLAALARHRTQYPIVPTMLPQPLLQSMLGTEFFRRTADGSLHPLASRCAKTPRARRPAGRREDRRKIERPRRTGRISHLHDAA